MSTVKDEANDGPDLSTEDDGEKENHLSAHVNDQLPKDKTSPLGVGRLNGVEEGDHVSGNHTFSQQSTKDITDLNEEELSSVETSGVDQGRPPSADGSLSVPDDTPSLQGSITSSSPGRGVRLSGNTHSPTPSLRPFDRRFQARASPSPFNSPRASSPAFPNLHSRQSSAAFTTQDVGEGEKPETPWEVVRWTKLRKMTGQALSEVGRRSFGRPTCIAVAASIALGTSKGIVLLFDYNQNLKSIIGPGTKALESGSVTSIGISADHSTIATGHATGNIFTWEVSKTAKPFLHIAPIDRSRTPNIDGHVQGVAIVHIGFLGMRHTALASADDQGMAFSHLATRGMGVVARSVKTTRILGRYPDSTTSAIRQRKPSSVLSFASLPFGNVEHTADSMGLVALLTPYLLVIVSTTPIAQTQYKAPRPKEVAAHGAMTAALAWFPSVKLKRKDPAADEVSSRVKLVYCWSNILTVLEIIESESSSNGGKVESSSLQFKPRSRWKAEEAIVGVQWLGRSVLAILTITQQLIILEDPSMVVTDSSDLIQKHIYHADLFSPQLNQLVDQLDDEEVAGMHGVVADAFYMSFRAYKGRLFLLGHNDISFGTLSNWADRLLALMEEGSFIGAIQLATSYHTGKENKVAVGLPEDDDMRHQLVREKLVDMITASLKYTFGRSKEAQETRVDRSQMEELSSACITACNSMDDNEFLFDEVYGYYQDSGLENILIECLEPFIINDEITVMPPSVIKDLVGHYTVRGLNSRLEEMICHLDPRTMDIDQISSLCKKDNLYDALLYVWSQALGDYTTILGDLLGLAERQHTSQVEPVREQSELASALKIFPYLSYILTGRIYPTGKIMPDSPAALAKASIYHFFFSGSSVDGIPKKAESLQSPKSRSNATFLNLRKILDFDAPSFLSMLNEAFEDGFLNGPQERMAEETSGQLTDEQKFGLSVNRQWIISILLEVMVPPAYEPDDIIYFDMFIARNLPKFQQFILLPGHVLQRVLTGLCQYASEEIADDCQLSVEYLLSIYQPPDISSLIPLITEARFYRVLKSIYQSERQYPELLQTYFEDQSEIEHVFDCIRDCLKPSAELSETQIHEVRQVIIDHAYELVTIDTKKAALTLDEHAPDLHFYLLDAAHEDDGAQFQYLQILLEPDAETDRPHVRKRDFVEQYVRLLCKYNPSHVSQYIEQLESGDLRIDEVLPALENSQVVDATVILMARGGKVAEGIDRLTRHLSNLESILLGLLDGVGDSPDVANTVEASQDLIKSIQKYARIGSWLCQRQTKAAKQTKPTLSRSKSAILINEELSPDEMLWLNLIEAVVKVTKNITEVLEVQEQQENSGDDGVTQQVSGSSELEALEPSRMMTELRTVVQETFTALLTATNAARAKDGHGSDATFLRIFRAFLSRASVSSPSLSNLRAVLGAIFAAYSYEESLLSLANRLLDKDLFVHVTEADTLRRRGWRPLGQVCEGCGQKIWGPGAGGYIWDAWTQDSEEREIRMQDHKGSPAPSSSSREGKGKAVTRGEGQVAMVKHSTEDGDESKDVSRGAVVVFSCRHMFHGTCLEQMQDDSRIAGKAGPDVRCPLCR